MLRLKVHFLPEGATMNDFPTNKLLHYNNQYLTDKTNWTMIIFLTKNHFETKKLSLIQRQLLKINSHLYY